MFDDYDPFSFASTELLTNVLHAEISTITQLLAKHADLRNLFDAPEATVPQRAACFALLAHRKLIEMIYDKFAARYEDSPSLSDAESDTLNRTHGLVAPDAPIWVQEMHQVVERLPAHIYTSLPGSLRMGGFNPDSAEQMQAIQSAKKTLSTVEQIQTLTERVLDQQLRRLDRRWTAAIAQVRGQNERKGPKRQPKGTEGLVRKADLSKYTHGMTEKQQMAFSLKYEYELGPTEIASRMGLDRKTVHEHIEAANKKIKWNRASEKRKVNRAKGAPEA